MLLTGLVSAIANCAQTGKLIGKDKLKMIQKLKTPILIIALAISLIGYAAVMAGGSASALITAKDCASGKTVKQGTETVCAPLGGGSAENTPLVNDIRNIIKALSAGVGVVVVGAIIVGGIQYIVAGDNPTGVVEAKKRIINGLLALAAFLLSFAFLQWLVPGGIFK
jgi:hypothetical protein